MISLESAALNSFYGDVLTSLSFCHEPGEFRANESTLRSLRRPLDHARVRRFFRGQLALCPRGLAGKVRRGLLEKFADELEHGERQKAVAKLQWSFLNVVLDDSVKSLDCYLSALKLCSLRKLVQKIAEHSPLLEKLSFVFHDEFSNLTAGEMKQITGGPGVKFLNNLTRLQLENLSLPATRSFCYIGDSCPNLVDLYLGVEDIQLVDKDLLNLFLGKSVDSLQELNLHSRFNFTSKDLHKYQFSLEEVQPFCMTLRNVDIGPMSDQHSQQYYAISPSTVAFALRHLPSLLKFGIGGQVLCNAIHLLSMNSSHKRPAAKKPKLDDSSVIMSSFTGFLPLESVQCLNLGNKKLVEAVTSLCPKMKNADVFVERQGGRGGYDASESVLKMRNAWPNLQGLRISDPQSPALFRSLLESFGPRLLKLTLWACQEIHPLALRVCSRLETLELTNECSFVKSIAIPSGDFLPNLKKIHSEICLGEYAEHILRKRSLVDVELYCFSLLTTPKQWRTIRDLWPLLERFHLHHGKGLTQAVVRDVFARYCQLKYLILPKNIFFGKKEIWTEKKQLFLENFAASLELLKIKLGVVQDPYPFTQDPCDELPSCIVCRWWDA